VLSPVEFIQARHAAPGILLIARANTSREAVIFARADSGIARLSDLRGKSVAFPDPDRSLTVCAKARLFAAGVGSKDLRLCTNIVDQGPEPGKRSPAPPKRWTRAPGEWEAGVAHRTQFDRHRHLGLVLLESLPETPNLLAARAGLDPRLTDALRNVVRSHENSQAWPEAKFVLDRRPGGARLFTAGGAASGPGPGERFDGGARH